MSSILLLTPLAAPVMMLLPVKPMELALGLAVFMLTPTTLSTGVTLIQACSSPPCSVSCREGSSSAGSPGECRHGLVADAGKQLRLRLHDTLDDLVGDGKDDEWNRHPVAFGSAEEPDADRPGAHTGCIRLEDFDQRFVGVRPAACSVSSVQGVRTGCGREGRWCPIWEASA